MSASIGRGTGNVRGHQCPRAGRTWGWHDDMVPPGDHQWPAESCTGEVVDTAAVDREELRTPCKRVAELEPEKDILRKAAAYLANEMSR